MIKVKYSFFLLCTLVCANNLTAQNTAIVLHNHPQNNFSVFQLLQPTYQFKSTLQAKQFIQHIPTQLQLEGYAAASIDSVWFEEKDSTYHLLVFVGQKFIWNELIIEDSLKTTLQNLQINTNMLKSFSQERNLFFKQLSDYYANRGYPFAQIFLDSIHLNDSIITAKLKVEKGNFFQIDSVQNLGTLKLKQKVWQRIFDISRNAIFRNSILKKGQQELQTLLVAQHIAAPMFQFNMQTKSSTILLKADKLNNNQFNALIGLMPQNQQIGGKLLFTGDLNLELNNAFSRAEHLKVNWQQIQPYSPRLILAYSEPYLFNAPFGVDFNLNLFKKDSSFLNLQSHLGFKWKLQSTKTLSIFWRTKSTTVLTVDTAWVKINKSLPDIIDVKHSTIGLIYNFNKLNSITAPTNGFTILTHSNIGIKKFKPNNAVTQLKENGFNYATLYDSLMQSIYHIEFLTQVNYMMKLNAFSVWKLGGNVGLMYAPKLFRNELFQIGGFKTLRGFDEESIFANQYFILSNEYRILLQDQSYFNLFADWARTRYRVGTSQINQQFLGVGLGLNLRTNNGILNLAYALGKRNGESIKFNQAKIHIGFNTLF